MEFKTIVTRLRTFSMVSINWQNHFHTRKKKILGIETGDVFFEWTSIGLPLRDWWLSNKIILKIIGSKRISTRMRKLVKCQCNIKLFLIVLRWWQVKRNKSRVNLYKLILPFWSQTVATSNLNEPTNTFGRNILLLCNTFYLLANNNFFFQICAITFFFVKKHQ